ncbi:hypothetical protein BJX64DRAFT_285359 [Aspergillus heterothallicus]
MGDRAQGKKQPSGRPPRRELNFIITNPASKTDHAESIRRVRSHAGRRRWDQAKNRHGREGFDGERRVVGQELSGVAVSTTEGVEIDMRGDDEQEDDRRAILGSSSRLPISTTTAEDNPSSSFQPQIVTEVQGPERFRTTMAVTGDNAAETGTALILNQQTMFSQHPPGIVGSLGAGMLDPFQTYIQSPLSQDTVSTAFKYCLSVLWPSLMPGLPTASATQHAGTQTWFSLSMTDPALHSSMLYGAYAHQRAHSVANHPKNSQSSRELVLAEVDAISKINSAIQNPVKATSDAIILSVLCLANNDRPAEQQAVPQSPFQPPLKSLQWLDIYGTSSPNPVHQAGLVRIIELCGGLDMIQLPGLAAVISFSDILAASRSLSQPRLPFVGLGSDPLSTLQFATAHGTNELDPEISITLKATPELHDALQAARAYVALVERFLDGLYLGERYTQVLCDARNFVQWHIMSLLPANRLSSLLASRNFWVYESCRLALIIFGVGVIFPLPPQSAPLVELARLLERQLRFGDNRNSMGLCFLSSDNAGLAKIRLWFLVMGGIAAFGTREREWFVGELARSCLENCSNGEDLLTWNERTPHPPQPLEMPPKLRLEHAPAPEIQHARRGRLPEVEPDPHLRVAACCGASKADPAEDGGEQAGPEVGVREGEGGFEVGCEGVGGF